MSRGADAGCVRRGREWGWEQGLERGTMKGNGIVVAGPLVLA